MKRKKSGNSQYIVNTIVEYLEDNERELLLSEVAQNLQNIALKTSPDQRIKVTSAVKLDDTEKKGLQGFFKKILNREYHVDNTVSQKVLGGIKIEWGDFMLDLTLRSRLSKLKSELI
jgi:F-type H+-transporting ATPase subunit delta